MKTAICQFNIKNENKPANKSKISKLTAKYLPNLQTDWLILPEMCLTGFSMNKKLCEITSADKKFFSDLAKQYKVNITYGAIEKGYNKSITIDKQGRRINEQSKMHLYPKGENKTYKAGQTQKSFSLKELKITPTVCYDLRFSYLFWNKALKTDIYLVTAIWPKNRLHHWQTLLRARAIENQAYIIGVNRIGADVLYETCGHSVIYDPWGEELLNCKNKEGIFFCDDIKKSKVSELRKKFPFLKSRKK